jgi:hypothetical protein
VLDASWQRRKANEPDTHAHAHTHTHTRERIASVAMAARRGRAAGRRSRKEAGRPGGEKVGVLSDGRSHGGQKAVERGLIPLTRMPAGG